MIRCIKCNCDATTYIKYSGAHLCRYHFIEFVEKRVKKNLRKNKIIGRIAVALSGGKDSTVMLHLLHEIYKKNRDVEIYAVCVDEGITEYRNKCLEFAIMNCKTLNIPYTIVRFSDVIGYTLDDISNGNTFLCTYCGVFRRYCLNLGAKKIEANIIAIGHNLDDTTQSILMNITKGDVKKLARMAPHVNIQKGLIPRIVPLRTIPEKEIYLYAMIKDIQFCDDVCPYADNAQRNVFRRLIYELEKHYPGTRHAILKTYDKVIPSVRCVYPPTELNPCEVCGEPTPNKICKTCELKSKLNM